MVATAHAARASIAVPYSELSGSVIYTFDFTAWTADLPDGWTTSGDASVARGYNPVSKTVDANVSIGATGGQLNATIGGLTSGLRYRALAIVRNAGLVTLAPIIRAAGAQTARGVLLPGDTRVIWQDFTATAASVALALTTDQVAGSYAATLGLDLVELYPIAAHSTYDLHPSAVNLTLDESWSPYARATLVCPMPPADALDKIDPRNPLRVALTLTRSGATSLTVADLTAMLAADGPTQYNLATTPRSNVWACTAGVPWASSALVGAGVNPPNGVSGGSRFIAKAAAAAGDAFTLTQTTTLAVGVNHVASLYARSSKDINARLTFTVAAVTKTKDVHLRPGRWNRIWAALTPTEPAATVVLEVASKDPTVVGAVLDLTQVQIEATGVNYLDADSASFETALGGWTAGGTVPPALTRSTLHPTDGTHSMQIVWGAGGSFPQAQTTVAGLVVGQRYRASVWATVPTGSPAVNIVAAGKSVGETTSGNDVAERIEVTFTADATTQDVLLWPATPAAAGDLAWIDQCAVRDIAAANSTTPTAYFDGSIGQVGDPRGFPSWTGLPLASTSEKLFGHMRTVADFTAMFGVPVRRNLSINPSFETNLTGWRTIGPATAAQQSLGTIQGSKFLRLTATGPGTVKAASPFLSAPAGTVVTVSAWVLVTVGNSANIYLAQYTGAGGSGSSANTIVATQPPQAVGSWQRMSATFTVAAGTASFAVEFGGPMSTGNLVNLDGVLIELSGALGDYFDGSTAAAGGWTYSWTGTAHASTSQGLLSAAVDQVSYLSDLFGDQLNATIDPALNQARTFDLAVRSRSLDYVADTMTLQLVGDEMKLQDLGRYSLTDPTLVPLATTQLKLLVSWALNLIGTDLEPLAANFIITAPAPTDWSLGQSLWDYLDGFMNDAGLRLWCDENRVWYLRSYGAQGTDNITSVTALDDDLDREGWGDAVVLANNWTDPATGAKTTTYAGSSVSGTAQYTKSVLVEKTTRAAATTSAAGIVLNRVKTRGRTVGVSAVNDYSVTPGHTANIASPSTAIAPVLVSAVTWDLPADTMTVKTRDLP